MAVGPYGAMLDAVRGVRWPARRAVAGGAAGAHIARSRGVAVEFAEYRPYRQGDDPRRIDWKLLGRSDRAFLRLAPDRSVFATTVLVDASASMVHPQVEVGKWPAAKRLAVALAAVAHAQGDPVGLVIAVAGARALRPRTRRGVVAEIAATLDAVTPAGDQSLARSLPEIGGRVAVISDALGDLDALLGALRVHVALGHEPWFFHVIAREELEPSPRDVTAVDPEGRDRDRPLTATVVREYQERFAAWRAEVARRLRDAGVVYVACVDDEPTDAVLRRALTGARAR
ncbi:MAG: DUF58 domain-containing protein [Gemmatimonadaceae bacterium]|nr:DUF58 domain-containing protein [Gemmatimonadaceae bacterium]